LRGLQIEYDRMRKIKWEYYTGKMDKQQLESHGWEPFSLRILKQDVDLYMNSDADLSTIRAKIEIQNEKVDYIESIIKGIMNRHWQIRSAIDWRKFTNGVN
jgi:DNA-binding transcriptional regulator YdaS (Cro superfamily)